MFRKIYTIILLSVSLMSCQKKGTQFRIDPELEPYYSNFLIAGKLRGQDVSTDNFILEFGDAKKMSGTALGYCGRDFRNSGDSFNGTEYNTPKVVIDKKAFDYLGEPSKRALIFHELGHCLLNRNHSLEITEYNFIKSIMYPYLITSIIGDYYVALENNYIDELFNPATTSENPEISLIKYHNEMRERNNNKNEKIQVQSMGTDGKCNHFEVNKDELIKNEETE